MELKKVFKRVKEELGRTYNPIIRRKNRETQKEDRPFKKVIFKHTTKK